MHLGQGLDGAFKDHRRRSNLHLDIAMRTWHEVFDAQLLLKSQEASLQIRIDMLHNGFQVASDPGRTVDSTLLTVGMSSPNREQHDASTNKLPSIACMILTRNRSPLIIFYPPTTRPRPATCTSSFRFLWTPKDTAKATTSRSQTRSLC